MGFDNIGFDIIFAQLGLATNLNPFGPRQIFCRFNATEFGQHLKAHIRTFKTDMPAVCFVPNRQDGENFAADLANRGITPLMDDLNRWQSANIRLKYVSFKKAQTVATPTGHETPVPLSPQ